MTLNSTSSGCPKKAFYFEGQSTSMKVQYLKACHGRSPILTGNFNCPMGINASPKNPYNIKVHGDMSIVVSHIFLKVVLNKRLTKLSWPTSILATIFLPI